MYGGSARLAAACGRPFKIMQPLAFTVVLPTYNRPDLVRRAVQSVVAQQWPNVEILVIDDGSTEPVTDVLSDLGDLVSVLRQESNLGVSAARNRGIAAARHPWILMFDDDDMLLPGALTTIADAIERLPDAQRYPVFKFGSTNSGQDFPAGFITPDDYLRRRVRGDLVPVLQRDVFLGHGFGYPETRVGGEHLLWLNVAAQHTIPCWSSVVVRTSEARAGRLTSARSQIARAREHAELQEETLARFGPLFSADYPEIYRLRHTAAATYWLLAGERKAARRHIAEADLGSRGILLHLAAMLPRPFLRRLFLLYRRFMSNI